MSTKIKDIAITLGIIILVVLIATFAINKIGFLSKFFSVQTQEIRVVDMPEYQASIEREKELIRQAAYEQGRHDQIIEDYDKLMDRLPQVNQTYKHTIKTIGELKPDEIDFEYQKKVREMQEALK